MSVARFWSDQLEELARHPNELDMHRIERAIRNRERYRYVSPHVLPETKGYLIRSPCCSRTVDPEGGVVDVALLRWIESPPGWLLLRKDHANGHWIPDSQFNRLTELFARLNKDPERLFWQ